MKSHTCYHPISSSRKDVHVFLELRDYDTNFYLLLLFTGARLAEIIRYLYFLFTMAAQMCLLNHLSCSFNFAASV